MAQRNSLIWLLSFLSLILGTRSYAQLMPAVLTTEGTLTTLHSIQLSFNWDLAPQVGLQYQYQIPISSRQGMGIVAALRTPMAGLIRQLGYNKKWPGLELNAGTQYNWLHKDAPVAITASALITGRLASNALYDGTLLGSRWQLQSGYQGKSGFVLGHVNVENLVVGHLTWKDAVNHTSDKGALNGWYALGSTVWGLGLCTGLEQKHYRVAISADYIFVPTLPAANPIGIGVMPFRASLTSQWFINR